jgi:YD repeat-containing protein
MAITYTPNYQLAKPDRGTLEWDDEINGNFDILDITIKGLELVLLSHINNTNNPHQVTYTQVGAAPASHTHTKSSISDLETITTTPNPSAIPKSDSSGKLDLGWLKTGSGSGLDADTVDGLHATAFSIQQTISTTIPPNSTKWLRIAQSPVNIENCFGFFLASWKVSAQHGHVGFFAGCQYGHVNGTHLQQIFLSTYNDNAPHGIQQARIVYTPYYYNQYAYIELYCVNGNTTDSMTVEVKLLYPTKWSLLSPPPDGSIPENYITKSITFGYGIVTTGQIQSTIDQGTSPIVVTSTTICPNLNADKVDGYDASAFFLLGNTNQSINLFRALNQQIDTRSLELVYNTNGNLTTVYEKDGETTVKTTTLGYDSNGNLSTVTEQVGGRTITTTLNYDANGNLTGITRQVS